MLITEYLHHNVEQFKNKVSLISERSSVWDSGKLVPTPSQTMTWNQFSQYTDRIVGHLLENGIETGSKVAILMENCILWLPIYLGILKSGAIAVPINYNYSDNEILYCLNLVDCSALILPVEMKEKVGFLYQKVPSIQYVMLIEEDGNINDICQLDSNLRRRLFTISEILIKKEDPAAIYFSSGTTGVPKAVLLSHRSLTSTAITEQKHHFQTSQDIFLLIPPLYHTGAKMHWLGCLVSGASAVLLTTPTPRQILETISNRKVTIAWLLLPWVQDILDAIDDGDIVLQDYDLKSWRLTHMGAQPIPPEIVQRWHSKFPNQQFDINYGLTEAGGPGCIHLGIDNIQKPGSIGKAGYKWEALIVSDEGTPVQNNVVGELIVKGDGVMVEYYKSPEETAKVLRNGWLFTGDMAYKDEEGFVYLVGRKKDLIISGGENIYPIQIENFLKTNPAIKDAAVIGVPNNRLGEIIVAIIEIKPGYHCSKSEIKKFCISLPPYKRPYKFIFGSILRNATGKIQKEKLREQYLLESTWRKHYNGQ